MTSVTREQQIILKAAHVRSEHETQAPAIHIPLAASKGGLGLVKSRSAVAAACTLQVGKSPLCKPIILFEAVNLTSNCLF